MAKALRVRRSLRDIDTEWRNKSDVETMENLIRAFYGISQKKPDYDLPPEKDLSYFRMAGFHGEPFEGPGKYYADWWGGYCHHNDVLFPAWHRAYLVHFENALRSVPGCSDVTLPFWDELYDVLNDRTGKPIPGILTQPKFKFTTGEEKDKEIDNPLFSYVLQKELVEHVTGANQRYSKAAGYQTVRYPLSGLVGTPGDREMSEKINAGYSTDRRVALLNSNVYAWLDSGVVIPKDGEPDETRYPDVTSVKARFLACFNNSEYTPFSNKKSMEWYLQGYKGKRLTSIEDPHNAIHLAVGGYYKYATYNADPAPGERANGDMGDNETAAFDPIFFLHHAFIDYVFSLWQKKWGYTEIGALQIDRTSPGAFSLEGSVGVAPRTPLDEHSYLIPFRNPDYDENKKVTIDNPPWLTTRLVTDISRLGYSYGRGSLDGHPATIKDAPATAISGAEEFTDMQATEPIDRTRFPGSFVIKTFAVLPSGRELEISQEAILSRINLGACTNCQTRLTTRAITPLNKRFKQALLQGEAEADRESYDKIKYVARIARKKFDTETGYLTGEMDEEEVEVSVGGY